MRRGRGSFQAVAAESGKGQACASEAEMTRYGRNGIVAGILIGVPLSIYNNPRALIPEHMAYVLGVILFFGPLAYLSGSSQSNPSPRVCQVYNHHL